VEKWLDLLTPSAAALALLLVLALLVQAIRHGRSVRRLEKRLAEEEGAAARVSLDRLQQLQRRSSISSAPVETAERAPRGPSNLPAIAAIVTVLALVGGTAWYVFFRDSGDDTSNGSTSTATPSTPTQAPTPVPAGPQQVPDNPEPLPNSKAAYTILVLNGTTIVGAAGSRVAPRVVEAGWNTADSDNATSRDVKESFVVYLPGKEAVADNVGKDLGIKKKSPADGISLTQSTADVDAIVIVGEDLANRFAP
jgi:hypothetical protein